ncbi:hypothetical protein [Pseudomonas sp. PL-6]|jgi:hypothetical protein
MSRFLFVPILALPLSLPLPAAELIPMNIKRIDRDHYQTTDELIHIRTRHCAEYAYVEDALLSFEPYGLENTLTFSSGAVCDVKAVYDRAANYVTSSSQLRR